MPEETQTTLAYWTGTANYQAQTPYTIVEINKKEGISTKLYFQYVKSKIKTLLERQ